MELEEVLAAAARGPAELSRLLDSRQDEITPPLVAAAEECAREGMSSGDGEMVLLGALVASDLHLRLGDRTKSLKWLIDFNGILYAAGDSTENYLSVRSSMLDAIKQANEVGSAELAFHAAVIAAESGFHASEGAANPDEWRRIVLADIASACRMAPADQSDTWYQRLVYLIAVAGSEAMTSSAIEDDERVTRSVRALAGWIEERVPIDFEFDFDSKVNSQIAAQLTELTARFA